MEQGVDMNQVDDNGLTGFHYACENGNLDIVKLLIEHGVDINKVDVEGENGFPFACRRTNLHILKYLQKQNVNLINRRNFNDETGLDILIKRRSDETLSCIMFLIESGVELTDPQNLFRHFYRHERDKIVKAIEDRINELTFTKQELFKNFTGRRVAKVITDFTMEPCTNVRSALENLRQTLKTLSY
jgi:hypothetical protein